MQEDPLGFSAGDVNFYRYALDNPVNLTDPSGMQITIPAPNPIIIPISIGLWCALNPKACADVFQGMGQAICEIFSGREDDMDNKEEDQGPKEHCVVLYVRCIQDRWAGPCGDCLNKCTAQGEWDFTMCHPE